MPISAPKDTNCDIALPSKPLGRIMDAAVYDELMRIYTAIRALQQGLLTDATARGSLDVLLDADDNVFIDARTNPRTITLGVFRIEFTPAIQGCRPINLDIHANGQTDIRGVNVDFLAEAQVAGDAHHALSVQVDTHNATGGELAGLAVSKSGNGTFEVMAVEALPGVEVLHQRSGTPVAIESAFKYNGTAYTDVTANFSSAASDVNIFDADNDYIYIGQAVQFDDIDVILQTAAAIPGIRPTFEYSSAAGTWTVTEPFDSTDGFRLSGNIIFPLTTISATWVVATVNGVANKYWIRIKRTTNVLTVIPREDTIKVIVSKHYYWDKAGKILAANRFESAEYAIPAAETPQTVAHGLGAVPTHHVAVLVCKTAELGYAIGDEIFVIPDGDALTPIGVWVNATTIGWIANTTTPSVKSRSGAGPAAITAANWKLKFRAWL